MQISTVQPVFKLELNHKVTPNVVTIAKYDGTHPCLTAAAGYDKIIIHHPHGGVGTGRAQRSQAHGEVSELNLSQAIIALACGPLKTDSNRDMLLIGSPTQILAYDVHDNTDLFFKEAPDGVNVIITGSFGKHTETLAIIGGNSSVQAIDWEGNEVFWNVVSGKVCAIITFDFDKDGENESKQNALAIQWSGDTLACCWSNGRVDWREGTTGRVLRRIQMRANAAAMLLADYRSVGAPDLVCVSDKGEVLGYPPYQETAGFNSVAKNLPSEEDRQAITELFNKKQALMVELQHYEANAASGNASLDSLDRPATAMPTNTRLQMAIVHSEDEGCLQLAISTNNETIVRAALVLAEGIFENGETFARHPRPSQLRSLLHVPLRPPRDVPVDVHIKALIGYPDSEQFHIFELTKQLPRFSMYRLLSKEARNKGNSYVLFRITERVQRICIWVNQNFLLEEELDIESEETKELHISLLCLRDQSYLYMDFGADGQVRFSTHDIRLAGDLIQSLAVYLNLSELQSTAQFPEAEKKLREEMEHVSQIGEARSRLAAETAERAQLITALLPAAQDAAAYDLREMLNRYKEVVMLNEELLTGCYIRRSTQEQAVASLKSLHTILQQAVRLRVGKYGKAVVAASRKAVQSNNIEALIKIMQVGGDS
ncbi:Bardet-Biedl syndrome 2 protein-like isoform X3 [Trichoplusia ni]|uniref:Bardet-Biedl syndrome 2 protein-like isoform X3 n=1 Tax=Trichoplusia ni TaxID=7111 RepID=A0A7E5WJB7_TRINI|nr:Bardet-Biedl syndrome 2 protein-like isoform X3 [Trichoplusia ni]